MRKQKARRSLSPLGILGLLLLAACGSPDPGPTQGQGGGSAGSGAGAGGSGVVGTAGSSSAGVGTGMAGMATSGGSAGATSMGGASTSGGSGGGAGKGMGGSASGAAGAAPGNLVYPPAAGAGDIAAGIEQLNRYRASLGFAAVTLDAASSTGCEGHLAYLIEEADKLGQAGYLEHTETDHANSHYSATNEQAGKDSDLAWGQSGGGKGGIVGQSMGQAVDLWINGLYHRHPLLDPGLVKLGAASNSGYNCVNYNASGNTTVVKPPAPILWPANGMTDVPRAFGGNEGPCPTNTDPLSGGKCAASGFIPSATFYNWSSNRTKAISAVTKATLTEVSTQAAVPLLAWFADNVSGHDPAPGYVRDEIALVPQATLGSNTAYRIDVDATVSGTATTLTWSFTTGTRSQ